MTFSWNGCGGGGAIYSPKIDIDLYLFKVDGFSNGTYTGNWVTGSHSVDDVNEGFEFTVAETGHYKVVAGWPYTTGVDEGCGGAATEPYGYAWKIY